MEGTGYERCAEAPEKSRNLVPEHGVLPPATDMGILGEMEDDENLSLSSAGWSLGFTQSFDLVSLTSTVNSGNNSGVSLEQRQSQGALRTDTFAEKTKRPAHNHTSKPAAVDTDCLSTLDQKASYSTLQEENSVLSLDTVDYGSLSKTVCIETSQMSKSMGSTKAYCSSVRSPTPYPSRISHTYTEASDQVAHNSLSKQFYLGILMDPLLELFGITHDAIYTDVQDRVLQLLQDMHSTASEQEQEVLQNVSAREIVKAVVQQINAALSRAIQQGFSRPQLLALLGSSELYSEDGSVAVVSPEVTLITPSTEERRRLLKLRFNNFLCGISSKIKSMSNCLKVTNKRAQQEQSLVVDLPASSDEGTEQESLEETCPSKFSDPVVEEITSETSEWSLHYHGAVLDSPVCSERSVAQSERYSPAKPSDIDGLGSAEKAVSEISLERLSLSHEDEASPERCLEILLSGIIRPHTNMLVNQLGRLLMVNRTLKASSVCGRSQSESALPKPRMTGELQREISKEGLLEVAYALTEKSIKTLLEQLLAALLPPSPVVESAMPCQDIRPAAALQEIRSEVSIGCSNPLSVICRTIIDVCKISRQAVEAVSEVDAGLSGENIDGRFSSITASVQRNSTPPVSLTKCDSFSSLVTKPSNKVKTSRFTFPNFTLKKLRKVNQVGISPLLTIQQEETKLPADVNHNRSHSSPTTEKSPGHNEDCDSCSSQKSPKTPSFSIRIYSIAKRS
ncbi:uncharacterized protein LOC109615158 [Esox lucius]|uniref:uncharacterized protein LOC109615158 n=1 Tax=Esox lucius TaxID=8010 RepID=UPI00097323E3|nr:uncharacterized protein LOC109615158 [Esox lucius]